MIQISEKDLVTNTAWYLWVTITKSIGYIFVTFYFLHKYLILTDLISSRYFLIIGYIPDIYRPPTRFAPGAYCVHTWYLKTVPGMYVVLAQSTN